MTIATTTRKAGPFAGNDIQTVFPFAFKVFAASDVIATLSVSGVEATLAQPAGFSVTLNADQDAAPGGNVTLVTPLASGTTLAITSDVPLTQGVEVTNGGGFFPDVFNAVFDRLTILAQQLAEKLGRALTIPITSSGVTSLSVPVLANGVLIWKPDGSALQAMTLPSLAAYLALPSTVGKSGQFLTNDGAGNFSWSPISAAVPSARTISAAGLATGGGDLTANRTITVPKAAGSDVIAYDDTKAVTGKAEIDACAFGTLTDAASIVWDAHVNGMNVRLTLTANGHTIAAPTNMHDGVTYTLNINPATFTVAFNAIFDFGKLGTPTLTASKWNKITGQYDATAGKLQCGLWAG